MPADAVPTREPVPCLLLFGGTRGTGLFLARLARQAGWAVTAMVRRGSMADALDGLGCTVVEGDALEAAQVQAVVRRHGRDGVAVSTLGGGETGRSADHQGNITVTDALAGHGPRRFVLVSSLGAGDSRPHASSRLLEAIGGVLHEKTLAEDHARGAGLDLTILRPGGLVSTPPTGQAVAIEDPRVHGRIPRADLAALVLACLRTPATIGRTLSAVTTDTCRGPDDLPAPLVGPA